MRFSPVAEYPNTAWLTLDWVIMPGFALVWRDVVILAGSTELADSRFVERWAGCPRW